MSLRHNAAACLPLTYLNNCPLHYKLGLKVKSHFHISIQVTDNPLLPDKLHSTITSEAGPVPLFHLLFFQGRKRYRFD